MAAIDDERFGLWPSVPMVLAIAVVALALVIMATAYLWADDGISREQKLAAIHPQLRAAAAEQLEIMEDAGRLSVDDLPEIRAQHDEIPFEARPDMFVEERSVPAGQDRPATTIYVVQPKRAPAEGALRPAIIHMHGGGMVAGSARPLLGRLQALSHRLGAVIVSVEYRLAPGTRWQGSLADNLAALRWLKANAGDLQVDPRRIAVMGESAGGGHAALLAIAARDEGGFDLAGQVLIYPMLDDRTGVTHLVPPPAGTLLWTERNNRFGWRAFLGVEPGTDAVPAEAVPARTEDLSGLPPAFIGVGSLDLFAEESEIYAQRLARSGVPVEFELVSGAYHGFDGLVPQAEVSKAFHRQIDEALARMLAVRPKG